VEKKEETNVTQSSIKKIRKNNQNQRSKRKRGKNKRFINETNKIEKEIYKRG
jgi:hypothetical protein